MPYRVEQFKLNNCPTDEEQMVPSVTKSKRSKAVSENAKMLDFLRRKDVQAAGSSV